MFNTPALCPLDTYRNGHSPTATANTSKETLGQDTTSCEVVVRPIEEDAPPQIVTLKTSTIYLNQTLGNLNANDGANIDDAELERPRKRQATEDNVHIHGHHLHENMILAPRHITDNAKATEVLPPNPAYQQSFVQTVVLPSHDAAHYTTGSVIVPSVSTPKHATTKLEMDAPVRQHCPPTPLDAPGSGVSSDLYATPKFRGTTELDTADCGTQAFYITPLDGYEVAAAKRNHDPFFTSSATGGILTFSTGSGLSASNSLLGLRFSNTNAGQPGSEEFMDTLFA